MKASRSFNSIFFLLVFLIASHCSSAQRLDSLLYQLGTKYPQEKVYIQYDKPYYNPGETIWFKGYITSDNLPSSISKTFYAELINDKGKLLQRKIMPVVESGAASFFDLPDSLPGPVIYVRAYTSWMLNFDSTLLYTKAISIINNVAKKTIVPSSYSLNFFPEGGDLVNGVESLVAFKATDNIGIPVTVSGNIVDSKGKKIVSFEPFHNGMGTFAFKPVAGETYKAIWKDKKGVVHETPLPAGKNQGIALSVIKANNQLLYEIKRPAVADPAFTSFYVIAQMQQQLVYSAKINMAARTEVTAAIPTDSLASGVLQLTVFNANEVPVAERISFINHNDYYFITDLHAVELNLNKRKHNTLQVDVGGSILSNLSISVTDESFSTAPANRDNIYSSMLLSSDLKGYIYDPAYYFSSEEDSVAQQLDLVMLTNGWRRFKWEDLVAGKWPRNIYQPEDFITIYGNVYGPSPALLNGKDITGILNTKGGDNLLSMPVTKEGKFGIAGVSFYDTAKLYYQFNQDKDKQLTSSSSFVIKTSFTTAAMPSVSFLNSLNTPIIPDTSLESKNKKITKLIRDQATLEGIKIKSLEAITVKSILKTPAQRLAEKYTSGFFTNEDAYLFSMEDDLGAVTSLTVLDYIKARVPGLNISTSSTAGTTKAEWRGSKTIFFLNESPTDINTIQDVSMRDVALVKVFRPPFFSPTGGGAGGAVAVYMKKGQKEAQVKGLDFIKLNGYSSIKEFYSPDYEKLSTNPPVNDYRSTLYWNPYLILDNDTRRIKIPFYNNDSCKKIRVIIEGINSQGRLTREEKVFE